MNQAPQAASFHSAVDLIRYGQLSDELDDSLQALVQKVDETGKAGELTLKIRVKRGSAGQVEITDSVNLKLPQPVRETTLAFALPNGALTRSDPRQATLDLAIKPKLSSDKPAVVVAEQAPKEAVKV